MDHMDSRWDDGASQNSPPLPYVEWRPRPVPWDSRARGRSRSFEAFTEFPLIRSSSHGTTNARRSGSRPIDLCWYVDETTARFPQHGEIAVQDDGAPNRRQQVRGRDGCALPARPRRHCERRHNHSIDLSGTIHILGAHDCVCGAVTRDPESRIILQASGTTGEHSWHLTIIRRLNSVKQSSPARRHPHRTAGALTQRPVCDAKPGCSTRWWVQPLCAEGSIFPGVRRGKTPALTTSACWQGNFWDERRKRAS